jgi:C-5 cytosine-specific DNA methylase
MTGRRGGNQKGLPVVSLFSGAMGLDLGLERAGFEIAVAVECNPFAVETIRRNRPDLMCQFAPDVGALFIGDAKHSEDSSDSFALHRLASYMAWLRRDCPPPASDLFAICHAAGQASGWGEALVRIADAAGVRFAPHDTPLSHARPPSPGCVATDPTETTTDGQNEASTQALHRGTFAWHTARPCATALT